MKVTKITISKQRSNLEPRPPSQDKRRGKSDHVRSYKEYFLPFPPDTKTKVEKKGKKGGKEGKTPQAAMAPRNIWRWGINVLLNLTALAPRFSCLGKRMKGGYWAGLCERRRVGWPGFGGVACAGVDRGNVACIGVACRGFACSEACGGVVCKVAWW